MRLRLLTYNIHKGMNARSSRLVIDGIREAIESVNADVVFLQEIHGDHETRGQQFEFLADRMWPHYAYGKNAITNEGHHGNAILSKFPFATWTNRDVSLLSFASRSILHGVIEIPDLARRIHLVCVHFGLLEWERRTQIQTLIEELKDNVPTGFPLVLAGDFNDWRGKADGVLREKAELSEAFLSMQGDHARSFPAWFPILRVDRIYYRGIAPVRCERLTNGPWRTLSDHLPLLAEFEVI